jgi:hypothetical protein
VSDPRCASVRPNLAEVALALLDEPTRSDVLAHVATCAECRAEFDSLVRVADRLVGAAPEAEPPPGFEQRVLARIDASRAGAAPDRPERRRASSSGRRWLAPVALMVAAVLVALALVGGVAIGRAADDDRVEALSAVGIDRVDVADLWTDDGERVGTAAVAGEGVPVFLLRLNVSRPGVQYECQLVLADGQVVSVGSWSMPGGEEVAWSAPLPDLPAEAVEARVLGGEGHVWARGRLG